MTMFAADGKPWILLVDDHSLVASGIAANLEAIGFAVSLAVSVADGRRRLCERRYDLGLFDITLPDGSGIELLDQADGNAFVPSRILFLSGLHDPDEILMALDGRRAAFLSKSVPFEDLASAIDSLLASPVEEPIIWQPELRAFIPVSRAFRRGVSLSPKEREVFQLMREGMSDKQIAHQLERSIHTVRVQVRSILRKRKSKRREEVV